MPGPFFWFAAVVGLLTLGIAGSFAFRPAERTLSVLRPLCAATLFAGLASFAAGLANGCVWLRNALDRAGAAGVPPGEILLTLSHALAAVVLTSAVLAVAWLLAAVGLRRLA